MDTIAHGFWAALIAKFAGVKTPWWLLAFMGMLPDLAWLPFTAWHWIQSGQIVFYELPYQLSHSLVVWAAVTGLATLRWRWAIAVTWAWALHILIDIPGHIHIQTPFLWPVSDFTIRGGWEWLDRGWMIGNYIVLVIVTLFWWWRKKKFIRK